MLVRGIVHGTACFFGRLFCFFCFFCFTGLGCGVRGCGCGVRRSGIAACHRGAGVLGRGRRRRGRGGAASCATRDLRAKAGVAQGAAGSVYQVIVFTNISSVTCTLYGYPGVRLPRARPLPRSARRPRGRRWPAHGRDAGAGEECERAAADHAGGEPPVGDLLAGEDHDLQIYPPNQTTPIYLAYSSTGCSSSSVNLLTIGVVQAGAGSTGSEEVWRLWAALGRALCGGDRGLSWDEGLDQGP